MSDDFMEMASTSAEDSAARLNDRIARERLAQIRSAKLRQICFYVTIFGAAAAFTCHLLADFANLEMFDRMGDLLMIPTLAAAVFLQLLGGLAPNEVRKYMSRHQLGLPGD